MFLNWEYCGEGRGKEKMNRRKKTGEWKKGRDALAVIRLGKQRVFRD